MLVGWEAREEDVARAVAAWVAEKEVAREEVDLGAEMEGCMCRQQWYK